MNRELVLGLVVVFVVLVVRAYMGHGARVRQRTRGKPEKRLVGFIGQPLRWIQTAAGVGDYELHAGNDLVATLRIHPTYGLKSFAGTGESAGGCWTFSSAWGGGDVTIRACGTDYEVARFMYAEQNLSLGGMVELPGGRKILLVTTTNLMSRPAIREFQNESGETLVRFTSTPGWARRAATVLIQPIAASMPELSWMLMLGWYVMMEHASETYRS